MADKDVEPTSQDQGNLDAANPSPEEAGPVALDLSTFGYSGLKEYSGYVQEEFLRELQGVLGVKKYTEMSRNSSTIGAILFAIKMLVRQVKWTFQPAEDDPTSHYWASFVETCSEDMSQTFDDFVAEVLSMLPYGWAYFEIIYKLRKGPGDDPTIRSKHTDGKVGWRKFSLRPQDTLDYWAFDESDDGLLGMHQATEKGQAAFIPIVKALLFRTDPYKNNPEGLSILRNAFVDYEFLKKISTIEAIGIERDLAGLPVMQVPIAMLEPNAPANLVAIRNSISNMLAKVKKDERGYAIIPSEQGPDGQPTGYKFSLLSTGGQRQIDTTKVKEQYKINILQTCLAQFIQLGMTGVGSFALSSDQTNLFSVALGSYLGMIEEVFNRFAIDRLMDLNAVPEQYRPSITHEDIETPSLTEMAAYLTSLMTIGKLPAFDEKLDAHLLDIANLPHTESH